MSKIHKSQQIDTSTFVLRENSKINALEILIQLKSKLVDRKRMEIKVQETIQKDVARCRLPTKLLIRATKNEVKLVDRH